MGVIDKILTETKLFERAMALSMARQKIIASNLANIETSGYRAKDLKFLDVLRNEFKTQIPELKTTHKAHLPTGSSMMQELKTVDDNLGTEKADGNNVDLEIEVSRLNFNKGYFINATHFLRMKHQMILNVLKGF